MKLNTNKNYSIESVNDTLESIGYGDVHIFDDPRDDGRISMIFHARNVLGEEHVVICLTDCMNAYEWMERFNKGRWWGIIPLARVWNYPSVHKRRFPRSHSGQK